MPSATKIDLDTFRDRLETPSRYKEIDSADGMAKLPSKDGVMSFLEYRSLAVIAKSLERIEDKQNDLKMGHEEHASQTKEDSSAILEKLESLQDENSYFRSELSKVNTPSRLKSKSSLAFFIALTSLLFGEAIGENIIHPTLAYLVIFASMVFFVMAKIMESEDQKNA